MRPQVFLMGRVFTRGAVASIAVTLVGVGVLTVSDVAVQPLGVIVAAIFIVFTVLQQVGHDTATQKAWRRPSSVLW